jgi:uncharacterized membrane protein YesL
VSFVEEGEMIFFERAIVRRGHPRHIILGLVGFMWGIYFLWLHNWRWAVAIILVSVVLGRISTSRTREESLAQTVRGKIMLLHLHPMNLLVQIAGFVLLLYGVWLHSTIYILAAMSVILVGHMWGWHKVSEAL